MIWEEFTYMNGWIYIENKKGRHGKTTSFAEFERFQSKNSIMLRETDGRFLNDSVFAQDDEYAIILTGVILNLAELKEGNADLSAFELLVRLYEANGATFMSELRGPFSGMIYDKSRDLSISFANQTGDMAAFIYHNEDYYVTASDFSYIILFLRENSIPYCMDPRAVRYMLTFGYMIDTITFAKQISRILPGHFVLSDKKGLEDRIYYELRNEQKISCSMQEAIELIDDGFRNAVKRCFDKDEEYGYTHHLADMSAGFDSRMTTWVARSMGYENVTNISYSQSGSDEQKYSSDVAQSLHNVFIHMQLDDASFLYDIDDIMLMNGGAGYYAGITGGNRLLGSLNFQRYGLEFTGQLGDVVIGTFCKSAVLKPPAADPKKYSTTLDIKSPDGTLGVSCDNDELYNMMVRGFLGCLSSHMIRKNYTYAVSPFIDVDFLDLCFSLPLEYRVNHKLYAEWVRAKYPLAFKLPSSRTMGVNSDIGKLFILCKRIIKRADREFKRLLYKAGLKKSSVNRNNMNPFNFWYETQPDLQIFIRNYYEQNIKQLDLDDEYKQYVKTMYESEKVIDKLMALTVLGVNKAFFA